MRGPKLVISLVMIGLVVVFVIQNTEVLNVEFLVWSFQLRRAVLIFVVLAVGVIVGWFLRGRAPESSADEG